MPDSVNYRELAGAGFKQLLNAHAYLHHCGLPNELLELVYLRSSQINGCAYCLDMHTNELMKAGIKPEKLMLVSAWREALPYFSKQEQAALAWAETVTLVSETHVPESEYKAAREVFSEKELVDLTLAISLINAFNRLAISFKAVPESLKQASAI